MAYNQPLMVLTIDSDEIEWALRDAMFDLAPEDYGLTVQNADQIVDERADDLVEALLKRARSKTYRHPYNNDFESWFKISSHMESIDSIITAAIDEWISTHINDAVDELED